MNQDISLIKHHGLSLFLHTGEYSTAWSSSNSSYHSLARRPCWSQGLCLSRRFLVQRCLDTWLFLFVSSGGISIFWAVVDGNIIQNLNQSYQMSANHVIRIFSHQQLWTLPIFWTFSSFIGGKCTILRGVCVCVCSAA